MDYIDILPKDIKGLVGQYNPYLSFLNYYFSNKSYLINRKNYFKFKLINELFKKQNLNSRFVFIPKSDKYSNLNFVADYADIFTLDIFKIIIINLLEIELKYDIHNRTAIITLWNKNLRDYNTSLQIVESPDKNKINTIYALVEYKDYLPLILD